MPHRPDRRAELAALGNRSRAEAEQHYDADVVAGQLEAVFRSVKKEDGRLT